MKAIFHPDQIYYPGKNSFCQVNKDGQFALQLNRNSRRCSTKLLRLIEGGAVGPKLGSKSPMYDVRNACRANGKTRYWRAIRDDRGRVVGGDQLQQRFR
jgi:hypothetical protein